MSVVIVKYNAGNIQSVLYALERIGIHAEVTDDALKIRKASKVIFPGVGEASSAMRYLRERKMDELLTGLTQPVLGICLGMQLLCKHSEEGDTTCLGVFDTVVKKFVTAVKVPQIGWNTIEQLASPLFTQVQENAYCYFVHSYHAVSCKETIATTNYSQGFSSALHSRNFYGVQFHPEKSADVGEQILKNFIAL